MILTHLNKEDSMKFLFAVLAVTLLTPAVFAIPAIGDYAKYSLNKTANGNQMTGILETTLTAYDQATNSFTEHIVVTDNNGTPNAQDQTVLKSNLVDDATLN